MVRSHPQYTEYEVSINSKMVWLWFTKSTVSMAELNFKLKLQANDIKISPNFTQLWWRIWNGPSLRGCSFDFLWAGNLSLRICTQTRSPSWKTTCLCPLLALVTYTQFLLLLHTLIEFFHHLCFMITIQTNPFINRQINQIYWS